MVGDEPDVKRERSPLQGDGRNVLGATRDMAVGGQQNGAVAPRMDGDEPNRMRRHVHGEAVLRVAQPFLLPCLVERILPVGV